MAITLIPQCSIPTVPGDYIAVNHLASSPTVVKVYLSVDGDLWVRDWGCLVDSMKRNTTWYGPIELDSSDEVNPVIS